jgi:hypothetical protein
MKYKNTNEFLLACNTNNLIKPLINNGYIQELNTSDLRTYNIKPKKDGFFNYSQVFDLATKVQEKIRKEKGELALSSALNCSGGKNVNKEYSSFSVIKLINPDTISIQRFLLATLSDKFEEKAKQIRIKFGIPKNGFNSKQDWDKFEVWRTKMNNKAKRELKNKNYTDYVLENRNTGYVFGAKGIHSDNIFTSLGKLKKETYDLFWKYNIKEGFIPSNYIFFGLTNPNIIHHINSINSTSPFQVSTRWEMKDGEETRIEWVNPKKFGIFMDRPVSKEALISYIKNSKEFRQQLNDYYNYVEQNENLQRDWLVYKYYKLKYSYKDIAVILRDFDFNDITDVEIKVIIHRLKKRIAKFEEVS